MNYRNTPEAQKTTLPYSTFINPGNPSFRPFYLQTVRPNAYDRFPQRQTLIHHGIHEHAPTGSPLNPISKT